jgi:hypothetical protein
VEIVTERDAQMLNDLRELVEAKRRQLRAHTQDTKTPRGALQPKNNKDKA